MGKGNMISVLPGEVSVLLLDLFAQLKSGKISASELKKFLKHQNPFQKVPKVTKKQQMENCRLVAGHYLHAMKCEEKWKKMGVKREK